MHHDSLDLLLIDVSEFGHMPPLGLLYVATAVEQSGMSARVELLKGREGGYSRRYLRQLLQRYRPFMVGMPVTAECLETVCRYVRWIRADSDALILLGGPEASAVPDHVFDVTKCDALIVGDGEEATVRVLRAAKEGTLPDNLSGIYLRGDGGIVYHDRSAQSPVDLENTPAPDYSLLAGQQMVTYSITTGRGCPFRCSFCFQGRSEDYRLRSVQSVLNELDKALAANPDIRILAFVDDTFTLDPGRVRSICEFVKERFSGPWFCEGRIGVLHRHPEIIDILADAGLTRIQLGLESGCQRVLDAYRKGCTPAQIRSVFTMCHEAGITSVIGNFIVGGAFEDDQSFGETLALAKDLIEACPGSAELTTCFLYPYNGTDVRMHPEAYGVEFIKDMDDYNAAGRVACISSTAALSRGEISQFRGLLQNAIWSLMLDMVDTLPAERILRHMIYARDASIQSEWYQIFTQCRPLALYARFQMKHQGRSWYEISGRPDWLRYVPLRIGYQGMAVEEDGILTVQARRRRRVKLSGFARKLYELSSGKLSFEEMLPYLHSAAGSSCGERELLRQVRSASEMLADNFLCMYSEV